MYATATLRHMAKQRRPRHLLCGVAVGLVIVNLVVLAYARVWRTYDPRFYRDRLAVCRAGTWDVVVAGGSPVTAGIDVAALEGIERDGKKLEHVFNLGMPLGTIIDMSLAVEHGLSERPPRMLIYGVAITDLNGNRIEPQGQRFLMDSADLWRWVRHRPSKAPRAVREFLLDRVAKLSPLAYHGDGMRFWIAQQLEKHWHGFSEPTATAARKNLIDSKSIHRTEGCLFRGNVRPDSRLSVRKARGETEPFVYLNRYDVRGHLRYLQRMLAWGKKNNVEVVLVEMPMAEDVERKHPREFAEFRSLINDVAQSNGLRLLSTTREQLGLTDAEFLDLGHLNADGVKRFSAWLRRELE